MLRSVLRLLGAASVALCSLPAQGLPSTGFASTWEPIEADYRNVRGLNYVPVYPSRQSDPNFFGVASPTAMWWEYDAHPLAVPLNRSDTPQGTAGEVYEQLGWVKKLGCNTVRVWLSFGVWEHFEDNPTGPTNEFVNRVDHFLWLCQKHELRVIPILWDGFGTTEPDELDPLAVVNRSYWHRSPGSNRIASFVNQDVTLAGTRAEEFITDMVSVFRGSPSFLMWDVMNEPETIGGFSLEQETFITASLAILKAQAPEMTTNLAVLWAEDKWPATGRIARDPNLDTLGLHPYGHTRSNIEAALWDARHVDDLQGGYVQKPILVTEIGAPGWALSYQDALRYVRGVPRPDLGPGEHGIGFAVWGAMVGWEGGNFLFKEASGVFHGNGHVREADAVFQFMALARSHGVRSDELFDRNEIVEWNTSGCVEQELPEHVDDWDFIAMRAWQPVDQYATMSFDEFRETCRVFRMVAFFLDVGAISSGANPMNDPSIWGHVIDPVDQTTMLWSAEFLCPNAGADPIDPGLRALLSQVVGAPFSPETNPAHLDLLTTTFLDDFRHSLLPYLVARLGPY